MFEKVNQPEFVSGEHQVLEQWTQNNIFQKLRQKNVGKPIWSFIDGPMTANNPMGVHHAWGRTYKDLYHRFFAMTGHEIRYQNGFDCQGLWVEVEVEKQLGLGSKTAINEYGIDKFVNACKQRVLHFAARQTEQSIRLGYWMEWDDPEQLVKLSEAIGTDQSVEYVTANGKTVEDQSHNIVAKLGCPEWGGSYFTFSTENNETIWAFLKKCHERGKVYLGHDVMPWSGRGGSAYSQMEVAEGRQLTVHRSVFVKFSLKNRDNEHLLIWTTTPWTLTSNVAAAINPELEYLKIRTKRDGAIYYFAKENLNYKRLEKEFKENFGRPEWKWPENVPKLKTLSQIFKEKGGYEELETLKGADLIGWEYSGPFDELPAQSQKGGFPIDENLEDRSGVSCHRVIDGGRDSKGHPHVVAGEGTGIVHSAPGCGDVDHQMGKELGLVCIAPLGEDGRFQEGFGSFTGKEAVDPKLVDQVLDSLKEKELLVYVEPYPHIYPHCWRTGDELIFRLVDEWFINMDWREEIQDVTRQINWLPKQMDGESREVEWLTNMRDWMVSKKRFWGLALPIWVDEETGDFDVIGSLEELKERAVEGWNDFDGQTPHRPWIDHVKIQNPKNGNLMTRVEDVGNPWLDAGIVPFSTLSYNTDPETWKKWYPADWVSECFPGQFRNWFYSLLSLSTMMQYQETDVQKKIPFKTLFGYRLVQDEKGQPMHKSDGTAIWFEEAAEQIGVDTIRWLYLAHNPSTDLRFGTRHKDQHVVLNTPDGEISATKEGFETCLVTSEPANEIRRQNLIPLWNSYSFFINYARLDGFDPTAKPVPYQERQEIDLWILSHLEALIKTANESLSVYDAQTFVVAAGSFIDDLSNWYIRRNRRRFWRAKDASDKDKLAAYQTMHEVLITLCQLLAPVIPFLTERMYANLVTSWDKSAPESVHLCDYPTVNEELYDPALNDRTAAVQRIVKLGHKLREQSNLRVRQPLAELRIACEETVDQSAAADMKEVIQDELNLKSVSVIDNLDDIVSYAYKPNLKTLGPKYGKLLGQLRTIIPETDPQILEPLRTDGTVTLDVNGEDVVLHHEDVLVHTAQSTDWITADEAGIQIALSTVLNDELLAEGMARDFVRHIQQQRKDSGLEIDNRITIQYQSEENAALSAIATWSDYIQSETLADSLTCEVVTCEAKEVHVGDSTMTFGIAKS